jgi:hypothetical protein
VLLAAKILAEALQWREQHKDILSGSRIPVWQSDFRVLARAESGHPLIYMCYRHNLVPNPKLILEHGAAVLEAAVHGMRGAAQQFDIVIDCYGFNYTHLDPRALPPLMKMLAQPYRDRLRTVIFVGASSAFNVLYRVGCGLVSEKTRRKAMLASPDKAVAHIAQTGGGEAAQTLKDILALNRRGTDCQPGEAMGRRMPSELAAAELLPAGGTGGSPVVMAGSAESSAPGRSGAAELRPVEAEHAPGVAPLPRWACCRRRRAKLDSSQGVAGLPVSRLRLLWQALA